MAQRVRLEAARRAVPVRTCVGCRLRAASADLLRVVAVEGMLVPDLRRSLPGRGAHLHLDPQCLVQAERRHAFRRALRLTSDPDAGMVREHLGTTSRVAGVDTGM